MSVFDSAYNWAADAYTDTRDYVDSTFTGSGFEKSVKEWKQKNKSPKDALGILDPPKKAWESWSNDYAYISWGGNYLAGDSNNFFIGNGSTPKLQGLYATHEEWSKPTTKNIIEWSKRLSKNARDAAKFSDVQQYGTNNGQIGQSGTGANDIIGPLPEGASRTSQVTGTSLSSDQDNNFQNMQNGNAMNVTTKNTFSSTVSNNTAASNFAKTSKEYENASNELFGSGGSITGVGNLKYDWKDFSFVKEFGKVSNNYLITLRRFKLPVLDNGVIAGKEKFVEIVKKQNVQNDLDYVTSDSARALTYYGEGTGNDLNTFVGFTVGLNWDQNFNAMYEVGNPTINDGISPVSSGGSTNAFNASFASPLDASAFITKGEGLVDKYGYTSDESIKSVAASFQGKLGSGSPDDIVQMANAYGAHAQAKVIQDKIGSSNVPEGISISDWAMLTSADADPFKNSWQHRIYGPINVITRTAKRARGLVFTSGTISVTFRYDVNQIENMNQRIAMQDIISNMLALTYNSGKFYGGDYRFHRQPTNFPMPETMETQMQQILADDSTASYEAFVKNAGKYVQDTIVYGAEQFSNLAQDVKDVAGRVVKKMEAFISTRSDAPEMKAITEQLKTFTDIKNGSNSEDLIKAFSGGANKMYSAFAASKGAWVDEALSVFSDAVGMTADSQGPVSTILKTITNIKMFDQKYDVQSILNRLFLIKPMTTGEPVGEWHLTIGNPMNPVMMIGNLICTGMSMSFGKTLGNEDFPTEVEFKVSLSHGRDRDMGDIESMFNYGQGRFYVPVKDETGIIVPQPWETGFSSRNTENDTGTLSETQRLRTTESSNGLLGDAELPGVTVTSPFN